MTLLLFLALLFFLVSSCWIGAYYFVNAWIEAMTMEWDYGD